MPTRVLIIDADESFAALLKEGLEADREYQAVAYTDGIVALDAIRSGAYDLVILDLGIESLLPIALLREIRDCRPDVPVLVIPVDGDVVPQELVPFNIKGVLTKPFFLPELPARIAEALGRPAPAPTPIAPKAAPDSSIRSLPSRALPRIRLPQYDSRVSDALQALADALIAEVVLLTDGNTLTAFAGALSQTDADHLARTLLESGPARGGAREQIQFGQSALDHSERLFYSLDFAEGLVLSAVVRPDASLHVIRAQVRQTVQMLLTLGT